MEGNRPKRPRSQSGATAHSAGVTPSMVKKRWKASNAKWKGTHGKFQAPNKPFVEKKNFDLASASLPTTLPSPVTATGVLLNAYTAGTNANTATGRRVLNKSLLLRMMIRQPENTACTATGCRVAVVYDRESNGAAPAITDIWGTGAAQQSCCVANLDNADRFSILMDEKFVLAGLASNGTPINYLQLEPQPVYIDRYVKLSLESVAKGGAFTGAIGGIATGSIYLFCWSDTAAGANPPAVVSSATRIRFQDG